MRSLVNGICPHYRNGPGPWNTRWGRVSVALVCALSLSVGPLRAKDGDLFDLSLTELLELEVTSVSKRAEPLSTAAAAIFVITADDIVRSGVASIPEALRLAPGMEVAQIDSSNGP